MAMENKRIIQLSTERTTLGDDDYTIVDSDTNGTAKYRLSRLKETDTTLSVSGMAADAAATGQAIRDEATARQNADTAIGEDIDDLKSAMDDAEASIESLEATKAPVIINSATGQIATFSDGADGMNVKSLRVNMSPIQDLHGYDHPWLAGGGKNLLNTTVQSQTVNGVTFTVNEDGTVIANGTATANATLSLAQITVTSDYILNGCPTGGSWNTYILAVNGGAVDTGSGASGTSISNETVYIYIKSGQTVDNLLFKPMIRLASESDATFEPYSNICPISGLDEVEVKRTGKNLAITQSNNTIIGYAKRGYTYTVSYKGGSALNIFKNSFNGEVVIDGQNVPVTFTADEDFAIYLNGWSNNFTELQLELSSTATDYEPYTEQTVTETLPETVYGGTLDLETGELTVDKAIISYTSNSGFELHNSDRWYHDGLPSGATRNVVPISNQAFYNDAQMVYGSLFFFGGAGVYINKLNADETLADFGNRLASNPFQICYSLATPVTYTLTPKQLETVKGINHISANGNTTIDVDYCADTKLYIDQKLATAIANALNA